MPSPSSDLPDFSAWPRKRLLRLLEEYRFDLASIRVLYGRQHADYKIFAAWIKAIEEELTRREK
jgi:hypothetical protein